MKDLAPEDGYKLRYRIRVDALRHLYLSDPAQRSAFALLLR
jgi:hypothetical protein